MEHLQEDSEGVDHPKASDYLIRPMHQKDIDAVVVVHLDSFSGFFLTFLGPRFLRLLYSEILHCPDQIAFVSEDLEGTVTGFVIGVEDQSGLYRRLLRRSWWRFGLAAMGAAIRQPTIVPRLLRTTSRARGESQEPGRGTLLSLAVLTSAQGRGIGHALVLAFLADAARRGLNSIDLTTDRYDNEAVNHFYQGQEFVLLRSYKTPEGREMNEYIIDLSRPQSDPHLPND